MPTAVIYHDTPIASTIRDQRDDLTVVDADSECEVNVHLGDAHVFVTNPKGWSDDFLEHLSEGDWLQTTSIGYAAFPIEELRTKGVTVSTAATLHDSVVSEHAFALTFALSRNIGATTDLQRAHEWDRNVGLDMWHWKGHRMTILGLGNIGESIARRAQAFGFRVYGVKRMPSVYSGSLASERVVASDDFHDLLPETDLLVLALPLTDETHHAVDAGVLAALPDTAAVVNVARGSVIDQDALVAALENGELGGAGLDVFEEEPLPVDSPLWDHEDVVVTPHVGGRSRDFPARFRRLFLDNYDLWRSGSSVANRID